MTSPATSSALEFVAIETPIPHLRAYAYGECRVLVGVEPNTERGIVRNRWHASISHPSRYPTWDEIKAARYELIPHNLTVAMILPPPSEYVNLHNNCFHLHEIEGES